MRKYSLKRSKKSRVGKEFVARGVLSDLEKQDQRNFVRGFKVFNISWGNKAGK